MWGVLWVFNRRLRFPLSQLFPQGCSARPPNTRKVHIEPLPPLIYAENWVEQTTESQERFMNGFSAAATSSNFPIPPPNATSETSRLSFPATRPEFSSFKFKNIGQPPTLLSRFSDANAASDSRSPSPARSDMDIASPEDPAATATDDHHLFHSAPRQSLLDMFGGSADRGHNPKVTVTQTHDTGVLDPVVTSPISASSSKLALARPESRLSSISRQLSAAVDVPYTNPSSPRASAALEIHTHELPDSEMIDLPADPASPSRSPLSLFAELSEAVRESSDLDRITSLHHLIAAEREELLSRHEETTRALSRTKAQLDRVLSLTDEAIQMTTVFVDKEKSRLETRKTKAETKIERRKNLEAEQRRKARELERIRQQEEERKAQVEIEQQAERHRLEDQRRKEEALVVERQRQDEIQARERAYAEERRRLEEERSRIEEEERQRLAEEDRRRRDEEEEKRLAEEQQRKEEEERMRRTLTEEREAQVRKQHDDRRTQLIERRRLAEEEMRQKEAEAAAAKFMAEKQGMEEQQRIFQERRATALKDKYKNYNRPESGIPSTGLPSTLEGTSSIPRITFNDAQTTSQAATEQYPGIHRTRDTPTFVPATTEAGRLPPDLSQQVKLSNRLFDNAVKHEATSPVIAPIDNAQPVEGTPPSQFPSLPSSSTSTSTPAPAPAPTSVPPSHLPAKPVYSHPPVPTTLQQRARTPPRRLPPRQSRSGSRSPPRSPRRGSPISRIPSRASRSPDPSRGRYRSPPAMQRNDHYSPPHQPYRDGGSRYDRDSRSDSPPLLPPISRKRPLQDHWVSASTSSKLDYSHPQKRRAGSPLRPRSPPSPRSRPSGNPPATSARRQPQHGKRGRGGGSSSSHVPLEKRLAPLSLGERLGPWDTHS